MAEAGAAEGGRLVVRLRSKGPFLLGGCKALIRMKMKSVIVPGRRPFGATFLWGLFQLSGGLQLEWMEWQRLGLGSGAV